MKIEIYGYCPSCRERKTVSVSEEGWHDWKSGRKYIQDAMPDLTPDEREFLLSGTCGPCFDKMFPKEED